MKTHGALVLWQPGRAGSEARAEPEPRSCIPGDGGSAQGPQSHPLSSWFSHLGTLKGLHPWKCFQFLLGLVEGGLNKRKKKKKKK